MFNKKCFEDFHFARVTLKKTNFSKQIREWRHRTYRTLWALISLLNVHVHDSEFGSLLLFLMQEYFARFFKIYVKIWPAVKRKPSGITLNAVSRNPVGLVATFSPIFWSWKFMLWNNSSWSAFFVLLIMLT